MGGEVYGVHLNWLPKVFAIFFLFFFLCSGMSWGSGERASLLSDGLQLANSSLSTAGSVSSRQVNHISRTQKDTL